MEYGDDDKDKPLWENDLDVLTKATAAKAAEGGGAAMEGVADAAAPAAAEPCKKDKVALRMGFTLPASTYATMLIRQLTRQCTDDLMGQESNHTAGGGGAKPAAAAPAAEAPAAEAQTEADASPAAEVAKE